MIALRPHVVFDGEMQSVSTRVRVAVMIDVHNSLRGFEAAFPDGTGRGRFSPLNIGVEVAAGNGRLMSFELAWVCCFAAQPAQNDKRRTRFDAETKRWEREDQRRVFAMTRPMRYQGDARGGKEVGVDMMAGLWALEQGLDERIDVVVLLSRDSDFAPVVETLYRRRGASHVETARWADQTSMWLEKDIRADVYDHVLIPERVAA